MDTKKTTHILADPNANVMAYSAALQGSELVKLNDAKGNEKLYVHIVGDDKTISLAKVEKAAIAIVNNVGETPTQGERQARLAIVKRVHQLLTEAPERRFGEAEKKLQGELVKAEGLRDKKMEMLRDATQVSEDLKTKREALPSKFTFQIETAAEVRRLRKELVPINAEITSLKEQIRAEREEILKLHTTNTETQQNIEVLRKRRVDLQNQAVEPYDKLQAERDKLRVKLANRNEAGWFMSLIYSIMDLWTKYASRKDTTIDELEKRYSSLVEEHNTAGKTIIALRSSLDSAYSEIEQHNATIDRLEEQKGSARKKLKEQYRRIEDTQGKVEANEELSQNLRRSYLKSYRTVLNIEKESERFGERVTSIAAEIDALSQKKAVYRQEIEKIEKGELFNNIKRETIHDGADSLVEAKRVNGAARMAIFLQNEKEAGTSTVEMVKDIGQRAVAGGRALVNSLKKAYAGNSTAPA